MKKIRWKYLILGFVFGLCFPVLGLIADCFLFNASEWSIAKIGNRILDNPIHFIIFSAPIVLGITFYYVGRVAEKREELNLELEKSNRQMKINNDLLDSFNYHVSHDLKTVLNNQVILTKMIQKYARKKDLEKVNEITERLMRSGNNGIETVKKFLEISQVGFISKNKTTKGVDIQEELARIILDNELKNKVNLRVLSKQFTELKIGPKVFESIMLNLLTNAIKYNDNHPEVSIDLKKRKNEKVIIFEDNGIGIDLEKDEENLFQPFNRITNDKRTEGTGIGLFLVKKMVNSLDGEISVESQLGKGTKFILSFPAD